jgi:hypothetical protein
MERIAKTSRGGFAVGTASAVVSGVAIFVFGAPPLILVVVTLASCTALIELRGRADRRLGKR